MLTDKQRFKAWQIVRLRGYPPQWHGSAWRIAAHIYRDRSVNLAEALVLYQESIHVWEDAYEQKEAEAATLRKALQDLVNVGQYVATHPGESRDRYTTAELAAQRLLDMLTRTYGDGDPSFACEGCGRDTHIRMNGLCLACATTNT